MLYKYIIFLITFFTFAFPVHAVTVKSYPVTSESEFFGNPLLNKVYYTKSLAIPYKSGRVVVSANPDGTGEAMVGEEMMVVSNYPVTDTFLRSNDCTGKMKPLDITHLMWTGSFQSNTNLTIQFRYNLCREFKTIDGTTKQYAKVGPLYVVNFEEDQSIVPFLDLPWDYHAQGAQFDDVGFKMFSFFDHQYPMLSIGQDQEPVDTRGNISQYSGEVTNNPYSSHDGYDYAYDSGISVGTSVLAAAKGNAKFVNSCKACGNAIIIDHLNGYQTRYYHLASDGLVTNIPGQSVPVNDSQVIGKVGMTGNTDGPHIHFMVIHDKNNDGNFDDNIPDGVIDPYGWQSTSADPWTTFTFNYNGKERTGDTSHWLWKTRNPQIVKKISPNTKTSVINGDYTFDFNKGFLVNDSIFSSTYEAVGTSDNKMQIITPGIDIKIWDGIETYFTNFKNYFSILVDFSKIEISRLIPETIALYSSVDGINWQKEISTVDLTNKKATIQLNHLTKFALMGEKVDSIPPSTSSTIDETFIENSTIPSYQSPLTISLSVYDLPTTTSLGIEDTFYSLNSIDWNVYTTPIAIGETGEYTLRYFSIDKDHNREQVHENHFRLIKEIQPEVKISYHKEKKMYVITDLEGNKPQLINRKKDTTMYTFMNGKKQTNLTFRMKNEQNKSDIELISIQYDNEPSIRISPNMLSTKLKGKIIEWQMYNVKDKTHLKIEYSKKFDWSVVKEKGKKPVTLEGAKMIILETTHGVISYHIE